MAHKSKNSYSGIAKTLKKYGLIDYDLRKDFNRGQKAQITKLAKEYKQLISKPETFYTPHVGKRQVEALKTAGYKVTKKGKALIPLHEFKSAELKGATITYKGGRGGKGETVYLAKSKEFFREVEKLAAKPLKRNEILSISIDGKAAFSRGHDSMAKLIEYVRNWQPKDPHANKSELLARMSIVRVSDPRVGAVKDKPRADKKNAESRSKRKRNGPKKGT